MMCTQRVGYVAVAMMSHCTDSQMWQVPKEHSAYYDDDGDDDDDDDNDEVRIIAVCIISV